MTPETAIQATRDHGLNGIADVIERLVKERYGAMHSGENWELMHAKAHAQLADYIDESRRNADYILNIARLLGCCDGDDTPELRIASLKAELAQAKEDGARLDWLDGTSSERCVSIDSIPKQGSMSGDRWTVHLNGIGPSSHESTPPNIRAVIDRARKTQAP